MCRHREGGRGGEGFVRGVVAYVMEGRHELWNMSAIDRRSLYERPGCDIDASNVL